MTLIDLTPTPEEDKLLAKMLATGFTIDQLKKEDKPRKKMLEEYQEETNSWDYKKQEKQEIAITVKHLF